MTSVGTVAWCASTKIAVLSECASGTFQSGETAYPNLRRAKLMQVTASNASRGAPVADQGIIWNEVADRKRKGAIHSPTDARRDGYVQRAGQLEEIEGALKCPTDDPVGVLAMAGGRVRHADSRPSLCAYLSVPSRSTTGDQNVPDLEAAPRP